MAVKKRKGVTNGTANGHGEPRSTQKPKVMRKKKPDQ